MHEKFSMKICSDLIHGLVGSTNKAALGGIPEAGTCADPEENTMGKVSGNARGQRLPN